MTRPLPAADFRQHSPGPWHHFARPNGRVGVRSLLTGLVVTELSGSVWPADRDLIVHAPQLLASAEYAAGQLGRLVGELAFVGLHRQALCLEFLGETLRAAAVAARTVPGWAPREGGAA